jgi:hypothetical protein
MIATRPKKPDTGPHFAGDSANFPTFNVNVPAPTKGTATSSPKDRAQAPAGKPKGK